MRMLREHESCGSMTGGGGGRGSTEGIRMCGGSRKRTRRWAVLAAGMLLLLGMILPLAGCGGEPRTIEDYLSESPAAQEDIESSLAGIANSDMDVSVAYEGNRILISCQMKTTYKKSVLKSMKKAYKKYMKKNLAEPMENAIAAIEQETGLEGVSILVTIHNGNGKEMWSQLYPLALAEEEAAAESSEAASTSENAEESTEAAQ